MPLDIVSAKLCMQIICLKLQISDNVHIKQREREMIIISVEKIYKFFWYFQFFLSFLGCQCFQYFVSFQSKFMCAGIFQWFPISSSIFQISLFLEHWQYIPFARLIIILTLLFGKFIHPCRVTYVFRCQYCIQLQLHKTNLSTSKLDTLYANLKSHCLLHVLIYTSPIKRWSS